MSQPSTTERIEELRDFRADWDGCGAVKPDPAAVTYAVSLGWLDDLPAPDEVSPSTCGTGVILLWERGDNDVQFHLSESDYEIQITYTVNTRFAKESRETLLEGLRQIGVKA